MGALRLDDGQNFWRFANMADLREWLAFQGVDLDYWQLAFMRLRRNHRCVIGIPGSAFDYEIVVELD